MHLINFSPSSCLESTVQRKHLPVPARIVSQTSRNSKPNLAVNETFNDKAHPYSYGSVDWVSAAVKSLSLWVSIWIRHALFFRGFGADPSHENHDLTRRELCFTSHHVSCVCTGTRFDQIWHDPSALDKLKKHRSRIQVWQSNDANVAFSCTWRAFRHEHAGSTPNKD